jgi:hypothetical protein
MGKVKKKVNLKVLGVNPMFQRGYLDHAWTLLQTVISNHQPPQQKKRKEGV